MKNLRIAGLTGVAILLSTLFSFKEDLFLISKNMDIFASLYKELNINYVEETDPSILMKTGVDAMLEGLDPYTEYIPESEIESYKLKYVSTQYGGIGANTVTIDKKLYVNELMEGGPAYKQELKPGDLILRINGIAIEGKSREEIGQLMRGPKGSAVKLQLERKGIILDKTIIREEIKQNNVPYSGMLDGDVGYIKLDKFLENAGQEVRDALIALNKQQVKGLILDLRGNGGGILQEAVKIVNLFVEENVLIVVQKGRNPAKTVSYKSVAKPVSPALPLVVLMDGSSASASEIVAGALQDLDRAVIIGSRSYGKGLVQQTFNLPYNSLVKITVAKYYTPSGRCIQALDYTHKDEEGRAEKFTGANLQAFSTKKGRVVYSGNGVYPDVTVDSKSFSLLTETLATQNLFFSYLNGYYEAHKTIGNVKTFRLSDTDYEAFLTSLNGKDYHYQSATEQAFSQVEKQAKEEQRFAGIKLELDALKEKIAASKKNEILLHKDEIKRILENQLVGRYYFEKGKIEQAFQYDEGIKRSKVLLADPGKMNAILIGEGSYKTIGSPVK